MYSCSHAKPTFCNVCREMLSGTSKGLSCEGMNNDVEFIWEKTQSVGRCTFYPTFKLHWKHQMLNIFVVASFTAQ